MSLRLNIIHKGLALVLIPLALNSIWLSMLTAALAKTDTLAKSEQAQSELLAQLQGFIQLYYETSGRLVTYLTAHHQTTLRASQGLDRIFRSKVELLTSQYALTPEQSRTMHSMADFYDRECASLQRSDTSAPPAGPLQLMLHRTELFRVIKQIGVDHYLLEDFAKPQKLAIEVQRHEQVSYWKTLQQLLFVGIGMNAIATVFLLYWFNKSFSKRLELLIANALKLSSRMPLSDVVAGTDELTSLDETMHKAADELSKARESRQSIVQMVAHDLRSPLSSSQVTLESLASPDRSPLSERGRTAAADIRTDNQRLLTQINDFLKTDAIESCHFQNALNLSESQKKTRVRSGPSSASTLFSPSNLKTSQKVMVLVMVPFIFNLLCIAWLFSALNQTTQLVEAEAKQRKTIEEMNTVVQQFYQVNGELIACAITRNETVRARTITDVKELLKNLASLGSEVSMTDDQKNIVKDITALFENQIPALMNKTFDVPKLMAHMDNRLELRNNMHLFADTGNGAMSWTKPQSIALEELRTRQHTALKHMQQLMVFGLTMNALLAIILLLIFNRDVAGRLSLLIENARQLSTYVPLKHRISGLDEIALLDDAIHVAATDLKDAFDANQAMSRMMADQLRKPIVATRDALEDLKSQEEQNLTPQALRQIDRVMSNNQRLLALIDDLAMIDSLESRSLQITLSRTNVRTVAAEAAKAIEGLSVSKNIAVKNDCSDEFIIADANRVIQVLINYLTNALKYSQPESEIKIESERVGDSVIVSVVDHGRGMSEEESSRAFEKFYRAGDNTQVEGFGLGLAVCRLIIESHNGTVGVTSSTGAGSRFWFKVKAC